MTNLKSSSKKSHYTIRRGPGKISHLLINNRLNSLDLNDSSNVDSNNNTTSRINSKQSPKIFLTDPSNTEMSATNGENYNNQSNVNLCDINVYIDDENDQEDYLTVTNATTFTTLTAANKLNNSDSRLKILSTQCQSTPIEPNADINFKFLSANYLSATSIRKSSNNDLTGSQNITTEYELSDEKKTKLDDESSLNDADDMVSAKKFYV